MLKYIIYLSYTRFPCRGMLASGISNFFKKKGKPDKPSEAPDPRSSEPAPASKPDRHSRVSNSSPTPKSRAGSVDIPDATVKTEPSGLLVRMKCFDLQILNCALAIVFCYSNVHLITLPVLTFSVLVVPFCSLSLVAIVLNGCYCIITTLGNFGLKWLKGSNVFGWCLLKIYIPTLLQCSDFTLEQFDDC